MLCISTIIHHHFIKLYIFPNDVTNTTNLVLIHLYRFSFISANRPTVRPTTCVCINAIQLRPPLLHFDTTHTMGPTRGRQSSSAYRLYAAAAATFIFRMFMQIRCAWQKKMQDQ